MYVPNTKIIHNPRVDELPVGLLQDLYTIGEVKPLCHGKDKGFRIEYREKDRGSQRVAVEKLLINYGISVEKSTEHISLNHSYLNIHIIRIPRQGESEQTSLFSSSNVVTCE